MRAVTPTADLAEVRRLVEGAYIDLRGKLFDAGNVTTRARLTVELVDGINATHGTGYSPGQNWINIDLPEGNLDDHDILDANGWPIWKVDLVEELAHEYQHKAQPVVTPTAKALAKRYGGRCSGLGHDEIFFAAVEALARILGQEPEVVARNLTALRV